MKEEGKDNGKKSVVFWLSARNIIKNKKKYVAALLAVFLTALLFSTTASLGYMMFQSIRETQLRDRGDRSMATLRFILPEEYEELKDDNQIKNVSYSTIVSIIETEDVVMEVRYGEETFAKNMYSCPTTGTMPEELLEFATSVQVLEELGVKCEIGEEVELSFYIGDEVYTAVFSLSGYWDARDLETHHQLWISEELCNELVPTPTVSIYEQDKISYAGYYMMDIDFFQVIILRKMWNNCFRDMDMICLK